MTCQRCRNDLRSQLLELPELYVYAAMSLTPDQRGGGGRGGTKVHAPIPLRLDILSLLGPAARGSVRLSEDQDGSVPVLVALEEWANLILAEVCRRAPTQCHRFRPHLNTLLDILIAHHAWTCRQDFIADYAREIRDLTRKLRGIARTEARTEPLLAPCPRCDLRSLVRKDWSSYAGECRSCGVLLTEAEYQDLIKTTVDNHDHDANCQSEEVGSEVCAV